MQTYDRAAKSVPLTKLTFQSPSPDPDGHPIPKDPIETVVPTNVHLDLLKHGLLADPHIGRNEIDVQWVHERDWVYKTKFQLDEDWRAKVLAGKAVMELACEGLDTFAIIKVNGHEVKR